MAKLVLKNMSKIYSRDIKAVSNFTLAIEEKQFIVLIGPSGCGKSTTLRMIAGLETPTSGELYIDDTLNNSIAPNNRNVSMVFQNDSLFPNMTVFDNVAFGLNEKRKRNSTVEGRVRDIARSLEILEYLDRKPSQLSAGQRHRVASGRALVRDSKVLLMDEPFTNLDATLKVQMREEIMKLYHRLDVSVVYVTHDQVEAMSMATKIVVMKDGCIQQIGTPKEIYNSPVNRFVASFLGSPSMNIFNVMYEDNVDTLGKYTFELTDSMQGALKGNQSKTLMLGVRPQYIKVVEKDQGYPVYVNGVKLIGSEYIVHSDIEGQKVCFLCDATQSVIENQQLYI